MPHPLPSQAYPAPDVPTKPAASPELTPVERLDLTDRLIVDEGTVAVVVASHGRVAPVVCVNRPHAAVEGRMIAILDADTEPPVDAVVFDPGDLLAVPTSDHRTALLAVEGVHPAEVGIRLNHGADRVAENTQVIQAEHLRPTVAAMHRGRLPLDAPLAEPRHSSRWYEHWCSCVEAEAQAMRAGQWSWGRFALGFFVAVLLVAAGFFLSGCSAMPASAATPADVWQRYAQQVTTLNTAVDAAAEQGWLDADDLRVILPPLATINRHLNAAEARLPEGGVSFHDTLALLDELLPLVRAELASRQPPTTPTTPTAQDAERP